MRDKHVNERQNVNTTNESVSLVKLNLKYSLRVKKEKRDINIANKKRLALKFIHG